MQDIAQLFTMLLKYLSRDAPVNITMSLINKRYIFIEKHYGNVHLAVLRRA